MEWFTISTWVYIILSGCVKLTLLFFYRRLFQAQAKARYYINGAIIFVFALNVALFFTTVFSCNPVEKEWNAMVRGHCFNPVVLPYISGISSSLTDLYVLILPIVLLWGLNMNTQRKLRVSFVFGLGILYVVPLGPDNSDSS